MLGLGREADDAMCISGGASQGKGEAAGQPPEFRPLCASAEVCWPPCDRFPASGAAPAVRRRVTDGGPQPWPRGNLTVAAAPLPPLRLALIYSSLPRPRSSVSTCPSSQSPKPPLPQPPCSCPERTPQMLVRRTAFLVRLLLTHLPHRHLVTSLRYRTVVILLGILDSHR